MIAHNTRQVVDDLKAAGLCLTLTPDRALSVAPACDLTPALRELIRAHKVELVAWLAAANDSTVEVVAPDNRTAGTVDTVLTDAPGPDRWCYPHSDAMNTAELQTFTGRLVTFMAKGLTAGEAEVQADKLVARDRDGDDRKACIECQNLSGWNGRHRCRGLQHAGMSGPLVAVGQITVLQRCDGFKEAGHRG